MFSHPSGIPKAKPEKITQTEAVKNSADPAWKPLVIPVKDLCRGDIENASFLVECYDEDGVGSDELIGSFTVRIDHLFIYIYIYIADLFSLSNCLRLYISFFLSPVLLF